MGDDDTEAGLPVGDDRSVEDFLVLLRSFRNMYSPLNPLNANTFSQILTGIISHPHGPACIWWQTDSAVIGICIASTPAG